MNENQAALAYGNCQRYFQTQATKPLAFRAAQLKKLRDAVLLYEERINQALYLDLGKSPTEAYISEVGFVLAEISHILRHLKGWAKTRRVRAPLTLFPARGAVVREPYGTVLVISAFNYPVQLLLSPLAGAMAAGNCAVVKPSEMAPATSAVMAELIQNTFPPEYIYCAEGGADTNQALLKQPFSLIFFTGSQRVGKIVMETAATHLTPVVLELGGKSPVIVDETADLYAAARQIMWGKTLNAGQTCVAPDYCLCQKSIYALFTAELKKAAAEFYGPDPSLSPDYGRIINLSHFDRLSAILDRDKDLIAFGGDRDREKRYIAPTLLHVKDLEAACMGQEIFGPVLPMIPYDTLLDAMKVIRRYEKPLALYLFTKDKETKRRVLSEIPSGGAAVNDTIEHLAAPGLPFGGVGPSGMGAYHGKKSFETFSHFKSVLDKSAWPRLGIAFPPYQKATLKWIKRLMK